MQLQYKQHSTTPVNDQSWINCAGDSHSRVERCVAIVVSAQWPNSCIVSMCSHNFKMELTCCMSRLKLTSSDRQYTARVLHGTAHVIIWYTKPIPQREWAWFRDILWNFAVQYAIQLWNIVACISCWQELKTRFSYTANSCQLQRFTCSKLVTGKCKGCGRYSWSYSISSELNLKTKL